MSNERNQYGFPVVDKFEAARIMASEARQRIEQAPCNCRECIATRNLPSVLRILSRWTPMDKAVR